MSLLARFSSAKSTSPVSYAVDGIGTIATIAPPAPVVVPQAIARRVTGDIVNAPQTITIPREPVQSVDARPAVQSVETIERLAPISDPDSAGNRIRAAQLHNAATGEGFGSVNREWYKRTLSYDQARDAISRDRGDCRDILAPRSRFSPIVSSSGEFALADLETGAHYRPTENALAQLANWCDTGLTLPKRLIGGDDGDRVPRVARIARRRDDRRRPIALRHRERVPSDGMRVHNCDHRPLTDPQPPRGLREFPPRGIGGRSQFRNLRSSDIVNDQTKEANMDHTERLRRTVRDMDAHRAQDIKDAYFKAVEGLESLANLLETADTEMGSPQDLILIDEHMIASEAVMAMRKSRLGKVL